MKDRFESAQTFPEFLSSAVVNRELWQELYKRARLPDEIREKAARIVGTWRFLVLAEDWCGDAVSTVPYLARVSAVFPSFELRLLSRDENPDLMEAHLTGGTRSIPVVMILDEDFREVTWWGPRPAPLQELFLKELKPLPEPERSRRVRGWYARDRGKTTLGEILDRIPILV